jgi:hypothetical protein
MDSSLWRRRSIGLSEAITKNPTQYSVAKIECDGGTSQTSQTSQT